MIPQLRPYRYKRASDASALIKLGGVPQAPVGPVVARLGLGGATGIRVVNFKLNVVRRRPRAGCHTRSSLTQTHCQWQAPEYTVVVHWALPWVRRDRTGSLTQAASGSLSLRLALALPVGHWHWATGTGSLTGTTSASASGRLRLCHCHWQC